jgi:predicted transcriptional regulator of viral defense system
MSETITPRLLEQAGLGSFFRPRDVAPLGISFHELQKLVADGEVERVSRGLYRLMSAEITQVHTLAAVAATAPHGIVCLLSALSYYGIGTQLPRQIWLAIDAKAHPPRILDFPVRLVRFSGPSLEYGVESVRFEGVPSFITNPARTVVDCFRFRRLVGSDVAIEVLRESLHEGRATRDDIWHSALACRAASLVEPVLEVMST